MTIDKPDLMIPGDIIDERYLIQDVKRGAMGVVYLCEDTLRSGLVAIKTFQNTYLNSEENCQRFLEEALMWIQLGKHPNVVQAFGLRLIEGKPFLLLERVVAGARRGVTLKHLFFSQPVTSQFMIQTAIHICSGMMHALYKFPNFVHSDLKSENILIGEDDIPKITDFGLTSRWKQIQRDPHVDTRSWSSTVLAANMEGTPAYASPEQCQLLPLDTRSDIYSFGCILYHLATKRLPFLKKEVSDYIEAHVHEPPVNPVELNCDVPPSYANIILKCMAKKPGQRYPTFEVLRHTLIQLHLDLYGVPQRLQAGGIMFVE